MSQQEFLIKEALLGNFWLEKDQSLPALIQGEDMLKRGSLSIPENKGRGSTLLTENVRFSRVMTADQKGSHFGPLKITALTRSWVFLLLKNR